VRRTAIAVIAASIAACVQSQGAERRADPKAGAECVNLSIPSDPLLAGLVRADRDRILAAAQSGLVVVEYAAVGCTVKLRVVSDCKAGGSYTYHASRSRTHQVLMSEHALNEALPVAGKDLSDALGANGGIRVDEQVVGRLEAPGAAREVSGAQCDRATHVASAIDLGSALISAGQAKALLGKSSLFDDKGGEVLGVKIIERVGSPDACAKAVQKEERTSGCDSPLRLVLAPIARASSKEQKGGGLIDVPAGEFTMGAEGGEKNQAPKHKVYLDAFGIDRTEVTALAYAQCVDKGACTAPKTGGACTFQDAGKAEHPINCVSFAQAKAYCGFVKGRLPTEAEWERAARGTSPRAFVWGDDWPPPAGAGNFSDATARAAHPTWLAIEGYDDGAAETARVGSFPNGRAPSGALDMAGNVYEWTADFYGPYGRSSAKNPKGPSSGDTRVVRGGSYGHYRKQNLLVTARVSYREDVQSEHVGFRCAH
jgi:formylglycine-generating enzyme required for sulfatase activity